MTETLDQTMTFAVVVELVAKARIAYRSGDSERGHACEDDALALTVLACADGHPSAKEMAKGVADLLREQQTRWYA